MAIKISDIFEQHENQLICKDDCQIIIDLSQYNENDNFYYKRDEHTIWFKSLVSRAIVHKIEFDIILDYPIEIFPPTDFKKDKNLITLVYKKGSQVLKVSTETIAIDKQANFLVRLMGGKEISKDVEHTLRQITKIYFPLKKFDQVHLEVLMSNILRDKEKPYLPARLGTTWDPVMMNIKDIVFSTSSLQGLAFENISKSITTGLTEGRQVSPSILEKILTGTIE